MTASVRTFVEAEVKCFLCADVSGLIRVERGGPNPHPAPVPPLQWADLLRRVGAAARVRQARLPGGSPTPRSSAQAPGRTTGGRVSQWLATLKMMVSTS